MKKATRESETRKKEQKLNIILGLSLIANRKHYKIIKMYEMIC